MNKINDFLHSKFHKGLKWCHSLLFQGSLDKINHTKPDAITYVGDSRCKDKEGQESYWVYFNPDTYSVNTELGTLSSIPTKDAPLTHNVKQRLKSMTHIQLSKDLRELDRTYDLNIAQNGNQKFDLKNKGLDVKNRFSCQRYMVYKDSKNDVTGSREYKKNTLFTIHLMNQHVSKEEI